MKLKEEFITYRTGEKYVSVTADDSEEALNGMVRNNETANFIFQQLMSDTTEEKIVQSLLDAYDVPEETAKKDVHKILGRWRDEGLLDE